MVALPRTSHVNSEESLQNVVGLPVCKMGTAIVGWPFSQVLLEFSRSALGTHRYKDQKVSVLKKPSLRIL